jgi:hypothetical protein
MGDEPWFWNHLPYWQTGRCCTFLRGEGWRGISPETAWYPEEWGGGYCLPVNSLVEFEVMPDPGMGNGPRGYPHAVNVSVVAGG